MTFLFPGASRTRMVTSWLVCTHNAIVFASLKLRLLVSSLLDDDIEVGAVEKSWCLLYDVCCSAATRRDLGRHRVREDGGRAEWDLRHSGGPD